MLLPHVGKPRRLPHGLGCRGVKDDRPGATAVRGVRREDVSLGGDVRFSQVPHALADDVADAVLLQDLHARRACPLEVQRSELVPPGLLERGPAPAPRVQRRDGAAGGSDEQRAEWTRRRRHGRRRPEDVVEPRHVTP